MNLAVFSNNCVIVNNNLHEATMPGSNHNPEAILPDLEYCNSQDSHRSPRRRRVNQQKKKKKYTRFTKAQVNVLQAAFSVEKYPDKAKHDELASQLGVDQKKVRSWFQNRRTKYRKSNKLPSRVKLDPYDETNENIVQECDGYCPTCMLPVHYRRYEDGRFVYSRPYNDDRQTEAIINEPEVLHRDDDQSAHDLIGVVKNEQESREESDDYDSILMEVEQLCK